MESELSDKLVKAIRVLVRSLSNSLDVRNPDHLFVIDVFYLPKEIELSDFEGVWQHKYADGAWSVAYSQRESHRGRPID